MEELDKFYSYLEKMREKLDELKKVKMEKGFCHEYLEKLAEVHYYHLLATAEINKFWYKKFIEKERG